MKLAITDACIFIDLHLLELTEQFFQLDIEVHTSLDVFNELNAEQQRLLSAYRSVGKLTIHTIEQHDRIAIHQTGYPRALSEMDCTVLYLAVRLEAKVLSSDKAVRNYAKSNCIEYHGMLWILDELISQGCIETQLAASKLRRLITSNYIYQNNATLVAEMKKRLKQWDK